MLTFTVSSDGRGHMFWKGNAKSNSEYAIFDIPERKRYLLDPLKKIVSIESGEAFVAELKLLDDLDDQLFKYLNPFRADVRLIGEKNIYGHKCKEWAEPSDKYYWWFDEKTGCLVRCECKAPFSYIYRLKEWNANPMPDASFQIPKDYKVQSNSI